MDQHSTDLTASQGTSTTAGGTTRPTAPKRSFASRLFGYDVFLSFALGPPPRGTLRYATDLARHLRDRDFSVFFSEEEAPPGEQLDSTLRKALLRSKTLVVVANRGTLQEPRHVRMEVEEFRRNHPERPVIPINVDGALQDAALTESVQEWLDYEGKIWLDESEEAVAAGVASDRVVERLAIAPTRAKANVKWRWVRNVAVVMLVALAIGLGITAKIAISQRNEAERQMRIAQTNLAMSYLKQARQELINSSPLRALTYIAEACRVAPFLPTARYMLSQAIRVINNHSVLAVNQSGLKRASINRESARALLLGNDGVLQAWDLTSRKMISHIPGNFSDRDLIAFSGDGTRIITKQEEGKLRIWDVEQGKILFETTKYPLGGLQHITTDMLNKRLVGIEGSSSAWIWNFSNGQLIKKIDYNIWSADLSANGKYLAMGSGYGMLGIWDALNGQGILFLEAPNIAENKKALWSFVKFARNMNRVLAVNEKEAVIIDIADDPRESKFRRLMGQENIHSGAFNPSGTRVATISWNGTTALWDSDTGNKLGTVQSHHTQDLSGGWVSFSNDGMKLATLAAAPRMVKIWDVEKLVLITTLEGPWGWILAFDFEAKTDRLITADKDGALRSWHVGPDNEEVIKDEVKVLKTAELNGDATRCAAGYDKGGSISVFDTSRGEVITRTDLRGMKGIHAIAYSPVGEKILIGGVGAGPQLWILSNEPHQKDLGMISLGTWSASFNHDGSHFVTSELDGTIRVWQDGFNKPIWTLSTDGIPTASISPDGRSLIAIVNKVIKIFDIETKTTRTERPAPTEDIMKLTFSPDSSKIAASARTGTVWVWDTHTGRTISILRHNEAFISNIRFTRDGHRLLTADRDGAVRVWDISTGDLLALLYGNNGPLLSVSETQNRDAVLAISARGWIQKWNQSETGPQYDDIEKLMECHVPWCITEGVLVERITLPAKCR
jgi:WD40 repeat protein